MKHRVYPVDMQADTLKSRCAEFGIELPENFWDKMERFAELVKAHNDAAGLISPKDTENIRERHIADSLALLLFEEIPPGKVVMDFGAGGGFPGIVLAAARPGSHFVLAESIGKKVAFLKLAAAELNLPNVEIFHGRAERCPLRFDIVALRATGPLTKTIPKSLKLLRPGGKTALWAGKSFVARRRYWENFLQKRHTAMEIKEYPPNWLPGRQLFITFISKIPRQA